MACMQMHAMHMQCMCNALVSGTQLPDSAVQHIQPHCTTCIWAMQYNGVQLHHAQHNLTCLQSDRHQQHLAASSSRDGGNGGA